MMDVREEEKKVAQIFIQRCKEEQIGRFKYTACTIYIYIYKLRTSQSSQSHSNTYILLHTCNVTTQGNRISINILNCS